MTIHPHSFLPFGDHKSIRTRAATGVEVPSRDSLDPEKASNFEISARGLQEQKYNELAQACRDTYDVISLVAQP